MSMELVSALIGFVGALAGSAVAGHYATRAAVKAVDRGFDRVEHQEIRRMKVECVVSIAGARFVLDKQNSNNEDEARFNVELNKIPVLFADNDNVMRSYRLFAASPGITQNLVPLMEALTQAVKIAGAIEAQEFERVLRVHINRS